MNIEKIKKISNVSPEEWGEKYIHKYCSYLKTKKFNKTGGWEDLLSIKKILDENNVPFWLAHGTLLGIIRDNDFISWDDAVDIHVMEEDFIDKMDVLKNEFITKGFIFRDAKKPLGIKINLYHYCNKQKNSISVLFLDPKYKKNKFRLQNRVKYPRKFFEKIETVKFKGEVFMVPSPPQKYLNYIYKTWKTPIKVDNPITKWVNTNIYHKLRKGDYNK